MKYRSCVIVLVGEETANRKWVKYEIQKAWKERKGLVGIYIHNINCPRNGKCNKGTNPFEQFKFRDGTKLSSVVKCYNPNSYDAYNDIKDNIEDWIEEAIEARKKKCTKKTKYNYPTLSGYTNLLVTKDTVSLEEYLTTYKSRITPESEELFVRDFLFPLFGEKHIKYVVPQYPFIDSEGRARRIDFGMYTMVAKLCWK